MAISLHVVKIEHGGSGAPFTPSAHGNSKNFPQLITLNIRLLSGTIINAYFECYNVPAMKSWMKKRVHICIRTYIIQYVKKVN